MCMKNKRPIWIVVAGVLIMILVGLLFALQPKSFIPPQVFSNATSTEFFFPMHPVEIFLRQTAKAIIVQHNQTVAAQIYETEIAITQVSTGTFTPAPSS